MKTGFSSSCSCLKVGMLPGLLALAMLSLGGCPGGNPGGNGGSLTGTWSGDVAYVLNTTLGASNLTTSNQTTPTTVTFDDTGKPDNTFIPLLENPVVIAQVPLADLSKVGDTTTVTVDEQGNQQPLQVTVSDISSSSSQFTLTLAVSYTSALVTQAPLVGPHNLSAAVQNDGTVLWTTDTTLVSGSGNLAIGTASTSNGTLTKQ